MFGVVAGVVYALVIVGEVVSANVAGVVVVAEMVCALVVVGVVGSALVVDIGVVVKVVRALADVGVKVGALVVCIVIIAAGVVRAHVGGEVICASIDDVASSELVSVLESKTVLMGVSHLVRFGLSRLDPGM